MPAQQIHNLIRGVNPEPGAWCFLKVKDEKKRLKIKRTKVIETNSSKPGSILSYDKKGFYVGCGQGALEITELQLEGKKPMTSVDFMRGIPGDAISFMA
jgi:methionyl-tRNA formyltransferase